ncbi:MAG: hypothetical protein LKH71_10150 [Lachnospiraceae bacterium]|nr:hypothetical protein [Lachnospiraceae bacterium]
MIRSDIARDGKGFFSVRWKQEKLSGRLRVWRVRGCGGSMKLTDEQIRYFVAQEKKKGTSSLELVFLLHDNGVPIYEISDFLDLSVKYIEGVLGDQ